MLLMTALRHLSVINIESNHDGDGAGVFHDLEGRRRNRLFWHGPVRVTHRGSFWLLPCFDNRLG